MDNQDQYNRAVSTPEDLTPAVFSLSRRILTTALVLIAALLLGYLISQTLLSQQVYEDEYIETPPVSSDVKLSAEEQALQRLEAFERQPANTPSEEVAGQLEVYTQVQSDSPTQEQLDRLQQFEAES